MAASLPPPSLSPSVGQHKAKLLVGLLGLPGPGVFLGGNAGAELAVSFPQNGAAWRFHAVPLWRYWLRRVREYFLV